MIRTNTLWRRWSVFVIGAALLTHSAVAMAGNLIQNGSFETYAKDESTWSIPGRVDFDLGIGNTDIAGWTVIKGKIDYFGRCPTNPPQIWHAADGDNSLELAASPSAGGVSQTFATTPGERYRVQFQMSGSPMTGWSGEDQLRTVRAQAAGQSADFSFDVAAEQNTLADMKWKLCTLLFVADSDATTLEIFSTMDPVHIGPVIDDVSVVLAPDWSPAGAYTGTNTVGEEILVTITPLGADNSRFVIVSDSLKPGERRALARGELRKTGPDTYAATQVAYMTDELFHITCRAVVSGTIVQTGPDTLDAVWAASCYGEQDPFAEGAVPLMCWPGVEAFYQRIPVVAPCVPAPTPSGQ